MALASAKQLLDELMGRDRNLAPTEKKNTCNWEDPDVCKHFLAKFCPNDLFVNTKADLGPCNKVHDDRLKREYEESPRYRQEGYEDAFLQFCQSMLSDVEKRIRRARQRLQLSNQEGGVVIKTKETAAPTDERVIVLNERIQGLLQQVEQLGCEGKVEEAQAVMKLCDQLKEERKSLDKDSDKAHWLKQTAELAAAQEKQMEVCDICGAFLIVGDAQQRVDDHLMGKQHMGYAKLKEAVEEIVGRREKEREEKEKQRERERERRRRREEDETRSRRGPEPARDDRRERDEKRHRSRSPRDDRKERTDDRRRDEDRRRDDDRKRNDERKRDDERRREDDRKRDDDRRREDDRKRDEDRKRDDERRKERSRRDDERSRRDDDRSRRDDDRSSRSERSSHRDSRDSRSSGHDRDKHHSSSSSSKSDRDSHRSSSSRVSNGDSSPRH